MRPSHFAVDAAVENIQSECEKRRERKNTKTALNRHRSQNDEIYHLGVRFSFPKTIDATGRFVV
jgi:hypothetical protein